MELNNNKKVRKERQVSYSRELNTLGFVEATRVGALRDRLAQELDVDRSVVKEERTFKKRVSR
jgi:hypothetical protein